MPWTATDASSHTHYADTPERQHTWARIANETLERTGDDVTAIRTANYAIYKAHPGSHHHRKKVQDIAKRKRQERKAGWLKFL